MGRPRPTPSRGRSENLRFRVYPAEKRAIQELAHALGQTPARVLRRLLREAVNGGVDFFGDGVAELRTMRQNLAAIGRNLNQLTRAVNRGDVIHGADLRRVINAARVQVAAAEDLHLRTIEAAARRAWRPLYQAAGLPSPFNKAEAGATAMGRPTRQPGRAPGPAERDPSEEQSRRFSPTKTGN